MQMLAFCYPALAVSTICCIWAAYLRVCRGRVLRDRVTFMLWTMANQIRHGRRPSAGPPTGKSRAVRVADKWPAAVGTFSSAEMAHGRHQVARAASLNNHGTLTH